MGEGSNWWERCFMYFFADFRFLVGAWDSQSRLICAHFVVTRTPNYMYTLGFSNSENQLFIITYFFPAIRCDSYVCTMYMLGFGNREIKLFYIFFWVHFWIQVFSLCTCLDSVIREIQYFSFVYMSRFNNQEIHYFSFVYMFGFSNLENQIFGIFIRRTIYAVFLFATNSCVWI